MSVLAHIHTLNDEDVIERSLHAVLTQTHAVDAVLIVDNGSTDGTLKRPFPDNVTLLPQRENLGTSGAVAIGLRHGIDHGYDWVWTFDADSAPRKDALQVLLALYGSFPPELQRETGWVACLPVNVHDGRARQGLRIRPGSYVEVRPEPGRDWYECDVSIWSGMLFRSEAVRRIGLPSADYRLDWGEFEYGYRVGEAGFRGFIHTKSVLDHDIGGAPSAPLIERRIGPLRVPVLAVPPTRAYYYVRNNLYFWLYEYRGPRWRIAALARLLKCTKLVANALLLPRARGRTLAAVARGYRDGLLGRISARYPAPPRRG